MSRIADASGVEIDSLQREGWMTTGPVIDGALLDAVAGEVDGPEASERGGLRNLLDRSASARTLASSPAVRAVAEAVLGPACFVARAIFFDKTPSTNWKVPWHQDVTIAVRQKVDVAGFGPWSVKDGVVHVRPPAHVLERMLAVRVHLDDCLSENGPVRVIPGSHREGFLSDERVEQFKQSMTEQECTVRRGGILAFFPLVLHASSAATKGEHRRVVHFEFATDDLPNGLEWHSRFR